MKYTRFTSTCILMSAAATALSSCRIINGKPDFNWITDQFTPVVDDSVIVDRGIGALDIPATEELPTSEISTPIPAPIPTPAPDVLTASSGPITTPASVVPQPLVYNVVAGDTLSGIAARHHTKTKVLIELNKLDINKPLQLNQKLLIPVEGSGAPTPAAAPQQPQPAQQKQPQQGYFARLFGQNVSQQQEQKPTEYSNITYTVVAGDTLSAIARRHKTNTKTLINLNRLDINKPLQINQKLLIPVQGKSTGTTKRRTATQEKQETAESIQSVTPQTAPETEGAVTPESTPTPVPDSTSPAESLQTEPRLPVPTQPGSYTIQPGDTLFGIARKLNLSPQELMQANGLTPETADKLQAGTSLNLPPQKQP